YCVSPYYVTYYAAAFCLTLNLLRREVVDIQGHLPVFWRLLLGHHGIWIQHGGVGRNGAHFWGKEGRPHVPRPVGGGECGKVLWHGRHAEGLVEDAAALVPVTEWVPARAAQCTVRPPSLMLCVMRPSSLWTSQRTRRIWELAGSQPDRESNMLIWLYRGRDVIQCRAVTQPHVK
uniref:Uncharacterized protein n=1 Tax=Anabas testudineus TaxID=64144 RepID=A0A3Q1HQL9_ANATE